MAIYVKPLGGQSGSVNTDKAEHVLVYDAWDDSTRFPYIPTLYNNVAAFAPPSFNGLTPTNVSWDEPDDGTGHVTFSVTYGSGEPAEGILRIGFDTTGGSVRMRTSLSTTSYPTSGRTAPDFKGAIEVSGGEPQGVDVTLPALRLSFRYKWPKGVVQLADVRNLARSTGKTNSDSFYGFDPGELLFLGATGEIDPATPTDLTYSFAASENATLSIGSWITGISKKGHQHLWVAFEDYEDTSAKKLVSRPLAAYVETLYRQTAFSGFGIGS